MSVRISVESLSGCAWNGCPSQRGIRKQAETGQKQPLTSDSYRPFTTGEDVYEVKVDQPPLILKRFSMRVDTSTYARKAFQALNHTCWLAITHSSC